MRGRINPGVVPRTFDDDAARVLHPAALDFIEARQRGEHRQTRRVARSPARRPQAVCVQIENRAVGRLPVCAHPQCVPRLKTKTRARLHDDGMPVAAVVVRLPLRQRLPARLRRPALNRHVCRDRIQSMGICPAVQVRVIGIIHEIKTHQRLIVRHEGEVHFLERNQRAPARAQVRHDLRNHRVRIRQHRPVGNAFVPRTSHRKNLHGRHHGVGVRGVEQDGIGDSGQGTEDAAFLIDAFRDRGRGKRQPHQKNRYDKAFHCAKNDSVNGEQNTCPEALLREFRQFPRMETSAKPA